MHDESIYAERALRAGARAYVMKKESAEEVILALRHALNGEYHVSKNVLGAMFHEALGASATGKRASASPLAVLTDRELEVFELVGRGKSTREIAESLRVSGKTIETHRLHIKEKFGLQSNSDLIHHATAWVTHSDNPRSQRVVEEPRIHGSKRDALSGMRGVRSCLAKKPLYRRLCRLITAMASIRLSQNLPPPTLPGCCSTSQRWLSPLFYPACCWIHAHALSFSHATHHLHD